MNIISKQSGPWSNLSTWGGTLPSSADSVTVNHDVTVDTNPTVSGIVINEGASLTLSQALNVTLQSSKNIAVYGRLTSTPTSAATHTIRFINVDESKFVGGGETILDSDVGLWVLNNGSIVLKGKDKQAWTNATGSIASGSTKLTVNSADGWEIGDRIFITPTERGSSNFDEANIIGVDGNTIALSTSTSSHAKQNNMWTAEVGNLTRNVRIEGTPTGSSHVFIKSTKPSVVQFVQFKYLGPRKNVAGDTAKELVVGRYALHFHHCDDATRGMEVEGCVATLCNNHAFVPHGSHGMMWCDNIAYNVTETPYWYDMGHSTHDLIYEENLTALVKFVSRAIQPEDGTPAFAAAGMILGMGDGNQCINNVVCGVSGLERVDFGGAYNWEANNEGIWFFKNNLAHHCTDGIRTWQNTSRIHIIENYSSYHCTNGIFHGAYANVYKYIGGTHYGSPITVHAGSDNSARVRFENLTLIGAGNTSGLTIEGSPVPGLLPVLVRNCTFTNCILQDIGGEELHHVDVIQSTGQVKVTGPGEIARVQPSSGNPTKVTSAGTTTIAPFAPTLWGTGDGLLGEYFHNVNFTSPAFTRVDPVLNFQEWSNGGVHHLITDGAMSVRWTGQIQPQFSETYTFTLHCDTGGTGKLIVNGKTLISANGSGSIALIAGQKYDIKIEFSSTRYAGVNLFWTSPSIEKFSKGGEYIPQSQSYSAPSQPPVNIPPTANAGADKTITLPTDVVRLSGSGTDIDGQIVKYEWTWPTGVSITDPNAAQTDVLFSSAGLYTFTLKVTDDKGATGFDSVQITVLPKPVLKPPIVTAPDSSKVISTTINSTITPGDGTITTIIWTQTEGPTIADIKSPTQASTLVGNLKKGAYVFKVTVMDSNGLSASDDCILTVSE